MHFRNKIAYLAIQCRIHCNSDIKRCTGVQNIISILYPHFRRSTVHHQSNLNHKYRI